MVGCVVTDNTATGIVVGAMSLARSHNHITDCVIADNHIIGPNGSGGAFSNDSSETVLEHCLIVGNSSTLFGGPSTSPRSRNRPVLCLRRQPVPLGWRFGLPGGHGGALAVIDGASLTLNGCLLAGNQASTDGGAIWVGNVLGTFGNCHVMVTDSALMANSAGRNGGGIDVQVADSLVLDQVFVEFNQAGGHGGGLYLKATPADLDIATAVIVNNGPDDAFTAG
jgi:hypothetical protein